MHLRFVVYHADRQGVRTLWGHRSLTIRRIASNPREPRL
mgnify:CR=1 FL=1